MLPMENTPLSMLGARMVVDALRDLCPVLPETECANALRRAQTLEFDCAPRRLARWPWGLFRRRPVPSL